MPVGRLPIDEQIDALREILSCNTVLTDVLARATELNLPGWYLTAGCVFQTVWNVVTGRPATDGILDYDLFYFDSSDLSWEAEDTVIRTGVSGATGDAIREIENGQDNYQTKFSED